MADEWHLWDRICHGDAGAFDSFYRQNAPRLQAFLRHLVGDQQAAEDLMQETFTQIWLRPNGFQPERGSLRAYLFGIGRKQAAEWWRSRLVARETSEENSTAPPAEIVPAINEALRQLPEEQQTLLWLREVEGQSYAELAQTFEIPLGTVRSRLFAAREALRKIWHSTRLLPKENL